MPAIGKKYGVKFGEKWYEEQPERSRVSECKRYEVWWDGPVKTPSQLKHNRPDLIVIDKEIKHWTIIDFF